MAAVWTLAPTLLVLQYKNTSLPTWTPTGGLGVTGKTTDPTEEGGGGCVWP